MSAFMSLANGCMEICEKNKCGPADASQRLTTEYYSSVAGSTETEREEHERGTERREKERDSEAC